MTFEEEAKAVRPSILRAILLQLSLVIATLVVAEAILRFVDLRYLRPYSVGAQRVYNYDAELGWFPVPNSDVTFTGLRTVKVHHNSLGLRDIEHDTTPRPTIAFVGDSRLGLRRRTGRTVHRSAARESARAAYRKRGHDRLRYRSRISGAAQAVGPPQSERRRANDMRRQRSKGQSDQHSLRRDLQAILRDVALRGRVQRYPRPALALPVLY